MELPRTMNISARINVDNRELGLVVLLSALAGLVGYSVVWSAETTVKVFVVLLATAISGTLGVTRPGPVLYAVVGLTMLVPAGPAAQAVISANISGATLTPTIAFVPLLIILYFAAPKVRNVWVFAISILSASVCLSLLVAFFERNYVWECLRTLVGLSPLVVFYLGGRIVQERNEAVYIGKGFIAGTVCFGIAILLVSVLHIASIEAALRDYWHGEFRPYFHNNYFMAAAAGVMATWAFVRRSQRSVALLALVVLAAASYLTVSRQVIVFLALCVLASPFIAATVRAQPTQVSDLNRSVNKVLKPIAYIAIGLLLFTAVSMVQAGSESSGPDSVLGRFETGGRGIEGLPAVKGRLESYDIAMEQVVASLPFGAGAGALFENPWANPSYNAARYYKRQPYVDNAYLTIAFKLGVLGLIGFTFLIGKIFSIYQDVIRALRKIDRRDEGLTVLLLYLFSAPIMLVLTLFQSVLVTSAIVIPFALLANAAVVVARGVDDEPRQGEIRTLRGS